MRPHFINRAVLTYTRFFAAVILVSVWRADGSAFTAGNVVVLIPQGTTSSATAISLTEYSPTGTAVQTISVAGSCTVSGSAISEGKLSVSFDGSSVSWGCYACAAGTATVATVSYVQSITAGPCSMSCHLLPRPAAASQRLLPAHEPLLLSIRPASSAPQRRLARVPLEAATCARL